jgi:hypothetical protein
VETLEIVLLIAIVVVVMVIVATILLLRRRKQSSLQERFGPEYEREVRRHGDHKAAEAELRAREERRGRFETHPLDRTQQERYLAAWRSTQNQFVDEPEPAVRAADRLVTDVMRDRGYPMDDFEQRAEDISVDYPHVVEHYRAAAAIATKTERGDADTEDLRQAMQHYRELFDELLETRATRPDQEQR